MNKNMKVLVVVVCFLLLAGTVAAQHLTEVNVRYDARYHPEFLFDRGGAEGHSGAYIQIIAGVDKYYEIDKIRGVKAKHTDSGFEVSLVESSQDCIGVWPFDNVDQYFGVWLRPEHWWMTGEWIITLKYKKGKVKLHESKIVTVPRFNFPPHPTGIQIADYAGKTWLVWNRIGDPGSGPGQHVEYRIAHLTTPSPHCIDEWYSISGFSQDYELWSGNRIAWELPAGWSSGDLIRIENRVYDDKNGIFRNDRGVSFFFLP